MSERTIRLIEEIRRRIQILARRMTVARLLYGTAIVTGIISAGALVAVGLEAAFWMAVPIRTAVFWLLLVSATVMIVAFVGRPLASLIGLAPGPSDATVAKAVGDRFPEVADRLTDLLQLASGQRSTAPEPLVDGAIAQLGERVTAVDYREVERFDDFRRVGRMAGWPVIGLVAFALIGPGTFSAAAKRVMSPGTVFFQPAPFEVFVEPGDVRIVKGDSLTIVARIEGSQVPDRVRLSMRRLNENRAETVAVLADSSGSFVFPIASVREGFQYAVEAGPVASATYRVEVSNRPFVRGLQLTLTPPSYTGLPLRRLAPNVGDVDALRGSRIDIDFHLGGVGIASGQVVFDTNDPVLIAVDGLVGIAQFPVKQDDRYRIALVSDAGIGNESPIEYRIRTIDDQRPAIVVLNPDINSEFDEGLDVDVSARITDDFGFSKLSLFYRLAESHFGEPQDVFTEIRLPSPARRELDQQIDFAWSLAESDMDLVPGDVITFYLEVRDNDSVSGFKAATSGIHTIRFPSLTDQFEAIDEQQNDLERALEDLLKESREVREGFEELRDDLRQDQEGDWEKERMVERLEEQQAHLEEQAADLADKMESLVDEMSENNLLSQETLERFEELNRVMKEISSPELQAALERLREAMKDLDLTEMQRSLGDFEFNEDQFKDRIERALALFKRLRTEQQLEEAARRAEDLREREEEMAEQTERLSEGDQESSSLEDEQESEAEQSAESEEQPGSPPGDEAERLAEEQERAAEDMEQLQELMERISEQMEEMSPAPTEAMNKALEQLENQDLQGEMRENAQDLREGELSRAQQSQQQMQQSLQQLSEQLMQMQQQMSGEQLAANLSALRRALDDVLTLSTEEERLRDDVRNLASRDAGLRSFAQQQSELLDGLRAVGDSLSQLSREIPQMSRQIQTHAGAASIDMERAVTEMTERRGQQAMGHQKSGMTNLNELALLLSDLMENLQNQQGGGGAGMSMQQMMQQLQQMAGQQGQINDQIQQFLNDMQGSRLSQDMQGRLQQMAAQQQALQKQLQEMGQGAPDAASQLLGDLEQIAKQMGETIQELQGRQIDRRTFERQQEILTRLLNAQRSMRERGKEKKRQGKTSDDLQRESPSELTPNERAERLRRELLRALESGYSPDYEELIRRYFEALQRAGEEQ